MARYFIHLSYRGTAYNGWQSQQNALSIQEVVERCLRHRLGRELRITGCGRTDTGVHARNFYAHFDTLDLIPARSLKELVRRLNVCLPADIVIFDMFRVADDANARFDAVSRSYHYYFHTLKNPFLNETSYFIYGELDIVAMNRCAAILLEYTDFTSFSKLHSQTKTNNCRITEARIFEVEGAYVFRITADRFLRNMVRAIAGTLFELGKGKLDEEGFRKIIEGKNRSLAGYSVPAHALFLEEVTYPESLFSNKLNDL